MIQEKTKHIVNFSGGKDSTAMLIRMLEENIQVDEIIFCKVMATPTIGGELPEMYQYINKINNYIKLRYNKEIKVIEQEKSFEDYFYTEKIRGKNKGKIYIMRTNIFDYVGRICIGIAAKHIVHY